MGPYTVLADDVSTIVLDIDGLPERINSDRIRPAPSETDTLPPESQGVTAPSPQDTHSPVKRAWPEGNGTQPDRRRSPRLPDRERMEAPRPPSGPSTAGGEGARVIPTVTDSAGEREWVIGKLIRRARDKEGKYSAFVKWYVYHGKDDAWEPEDVLSPRLVARLAKSQPGDLVDLSRLWLLAEPTGSRVARSRCTATCSLIRGPTSLDHPPTGAIEYTPARGGGTY